MVSSDFGKLEVSRHLISGEDCAMAGEATVAIAAPAADTFKNSRRFIKTISSLGVSHILRRRGGTIRSGQRRFSPRSLTWKFSSGIRDKGMTALHCLNESRICSEE